MNVRIKIFFSLSLAFSSFIIFAGDVKAVVPTWDVGLNGPVPAINALGDSGYHHDKEFQIGSLGDLTSVDGIVSLATKIGKKALNAFSPSWDGIARFIAHVALQEIRNSMIAWIQNDFEGSPSFIDNPEDFLGGVGNIAASNFINQLSADITGNPDFLCRDFRGLFPKLLVPRGVGAGYQFRFRCSISDIQQNIERFSDDFSAGGFDRFLEARQSNNNFYGVYWGLLDEIDQRYDTAYQSRLQEATWSDGFLSKQECVEVGAEPYGGGPPPCVKYATITPGKTIGDRVSSVLSADVQEVVQADEMSEVIQTIVDAALNQAFKIGLSKVGGN